MSGTSDTSVGNLKTDKLEWIRIFDPIHIPRHLVEQIRNRDWSIDKFYQYQQHACVKNENGKLNLNPFNLLYVITDENRKVYGFMWSVIDPLSNCLVINSFSMEKGEWENGKCVSLLEEKCKEIAIGAKLDKVYWITNYPKHSEKHGFRRSKSILMEYDMKENSHGQNDDGGGCEARRDSPTNGSEPIAVPTADAGGPWRPRSSSRPGIVAGV